MQSALISFDPTAGQAKIVRPNKRSLKYLAQSMIRTMKGNKHFEMIKFLYAGTCICFKAPYFKVGKSVFAHNNWVSPFCFQDEWV